MAWFLVQNPHGEPLIVAQWAAAVCPAYPTRAQCFRSANMPWAIKFHAKDRNRALQKARQRQTTDEFKETYVRRPGVEGTISQPTQVCGLRRSRYGGVAKTHLQHVFTAVAINLMRLAGADQYYYLHDGLGSVRHPSTGLRAGLLDSTGQIAAKYAYDPFGVPLAGDGVPNPYQFTGEGWDA